MTLKTACTVLVPLLAGACLCSILHETYAQQSYPLVCRGGGNLHFNYTPFSNFSQSPQIWISFEKGAQAVGSNWENMHSLQPGQCAWLDRTIGPNEPARIIVLQPVLQRNDFSIQWQQGRVTGISSSLPYINALQRSDAYQSFDVYNDQRGNFLVTRIGQQR